MLKNNKIPGISTGTRAAKAPVPVGSAARFLGESQDGLCVGPSGCLDWGAWIRGISQKEKEKKEALSGCLENSPQQSWAFWAPTSAAPGWCTLDQQGVAAGTHACSTRMEHLPPSLCTQSPAGLTGSLGGMWNAQQRGDAGLGEIQD